jgi:choline dehydrogenase-like flavoprotein
MLGCGYYQATMKDGRRCSTARAYIDSIRSQSNFTLIRDALVTKFVIERGHIRGVEYIAEGRTLETVFADAEVICTAGAIGSPHLLMLSGIGPADHLQDHGIKVEADLPRVGRDLQDHMGTGSVGLAIKDPGAVFGSVPNSFAEAVQEFEAEGRGRVYGDQPRCANRIMPIPVPLFKCRHVVLFHDPQFTKRRPHGVGDVGRPKVCVVFFANSRVGVA